MSSSTPSPTLSWTAALVEREPQLLAAALWAEALAPGLRVQLSAAAERLASLSAPLLEPFLLGARAALGRFGPEGFERWWQLGLALARNVKTRRAAELYFTLSPADFGPDGLDAAETWCALGVRVSERSRHLAAAYFAKTLPVLAADSGCERLRAWVDASLALLDRPGWQAQLVVELAFSNAPSSVLASRAPVQWYELVLALAPVVAPQHILAAAPSALNELDAAAQIGLFLALTSAARHDAACAHELYQHLPDILAPLPSGARLALTELISALSVNGYPSEPDVEVSARKTHTRARSAAREQAPAPEPLTPWDEARGAGDDPFTDELPTAERTAATQVAPGRDALRALAGGMSALRQGVEASSSLQLMAAASALLPVARTSPEAAVAALLRLPVLFRHADAPNAMRWVEHGASLAAERPAAAVAYFALASRSSRAALFAAGSGVPLESELGVWRKLIEMASGEPAVIRRCAVLSLRPSLEVDPELGEVELPELSDVLTDREDNRAVLRFIAWQLAGRRAFGTYARKVVPQLTAARPELEHLFLVAEGIRIQQRIAEAYPGTVDETHELAAKLLEAWHTDPPTTFARLSDVLLVLALAHPAPEGPARALHAAPDWLARELVHELMNGAARLRAPDATVLMSLDVAARLASCVSPVVAVPPMAANGVLPQLATLAAPEYSAASHVDSNAGAAAPGEHVQLTAGGNAPAASLNGPWLDAAAGSGAEEAAGGADSPGLPLVDRSYQRRGVQSFVYDEWDYTIGDYRAQHCRVQELPLAPDSGLFFERKLREARSLLTEVKRQFEQLRPERYRPLFGLEDGEDIDLNALIDARVEARTGHTPSARVYTSRTRRARDVATLFLVDMSASTDAEQADGQRVIDTLKEALIVMTVALEQLGDQYAIYGFSSRGRDRVEIYPVKAFHEPLDHNVQARIGGIEPKSGTRMGAALRHMIPKFSAVNARSKHLMLLSDGFPQDHDYGTDRRTHTYGIEDTAVALREVSAAGPLPFCVTIDRAGNDYLRCMCDPAQYLIIDDIAALPRELPKIYRRVARE